MICYLVTRSSGCTLIEAQTLRFGKFVTLASLELRGEEWWEHSGAEVELNELMSEVDQILATNRRVVWEYTLD